MAVTKVKLNRKGVGQLLKSEDLEKGLADLAAKNAQGWDTDTKVMKTRVIASIYTTDKKKIAGELDDHAIVGGLHGN